MQTPSRRLLWLIYFTSLLRLVLGWAVELGNDEVYYHTYAAYPAFSHFDHPPMVGIVIWLFSLGCYLKHHILMRLGAIILAIANTFIIWQIGYKLKNETTAWFAALLYNASFYTSLIAGIFIMPDTPQVFFWLLSLWLMLSISRSETITYKNKRHMLLLGVSIGLAMFSKYTSAFLWLGFLGFLLLHKREWFKKAELYLSGLISLLLFSPVLYWNFRNNFISFTFHENRVKIAESTQLHWDYLGSELGGAFLYQNPIVFILICITVVSLIFSKNKQPRNTDHSLLLWTSIPLILTFLSISLFKRTLPHWTGPAYLALILLTASFLAEKHAHNKKRTPFIIKIALILFVAGSFTAMLQVNRGLFPLDKFGNDPTLEMYGWTYIGTRFESIKEDTEYSQKADKDTPVLADNWFDAAHLDYYVALPNNSEVMVWGSLDRIHKYAWINKTRGGFESGMDFWYISFNGSQDIKKFHPFFKDIEFIDNFSIYRSNNKAKEVHVFLLKGLKYTPEFSWETLELY